MLNDSATSAATVGQGGAESTAVLPARGGARSEGATPQGNPIDGGETNGRAEQPKFVVNHPAILCTAVRFDEGVYCTDGLLQAVFRVLCLCWWHAAGGVEVLDGTTGMVAADACRGGGPPGAGCTPPRSHPGGVDAAAARLHEETGTEEAAPDEGAHQQLSGILRQPRVSKISRAAMLDTVLQTAAAGSGGVRTETAVGDVPTLYMQQKLVCKTYVQARDVLCDCFNKLMP